FVAAFSVKPVGEAWQTAWQSAEYIELSIRPIRNRKVSVAAGVRSGLIDVCYFPSRRVAIPDAHGRASRKSFGQPTRNVSPIGTAERSRVIHECFLLAAARFRSCWVSYACHAMQRVLGLDGD